MTIVSTLTEHINVLETHWDEIVQQINNPNGIMNHLLRTTILNEAEVYKIDLKETKPDKLEALLNILIRKPDLAFNGFCDALTEEDQCHFFVKHLGNLFAYYCKPIFLI